MKNMRLAVAAVIALVALGVRPPTADAAPCGGFVHIVPDGRVSALTTIDSTLDLQVTFWAVGGRSYSVEINEYDYTNTVTAVFGASGVLCPTVDMPGLTHTESTDPFVIDNTAKRASFVEPGTGVNFHVIRVGVTSGAHPFTFTISDTTLYSPAWSTNGTYDTFYSLLNTTRSSCSGTLTLYDTAGSPVSTAPLTVLPGATGSTNTSALATPRNSAGTAKFTHNCPPGAFLAEAAIANFTLTPTPYFQFVHFQPTRESAH